MALSEKIAGPGRMGRALRRRLGRRVSAWMPKGLYARSLIIIVAPIVILQAVVAFVFMERHWQQVTGQLSEAVAQHIGGLIAFYEAHPDIDEDQLARIAAARFGLVVEFRPPEPLPPAAPRPFFSLLDQTLADNLSQQIDAPFRIDTVSHPNMVEILIERDDSVMKVLARRSQAYASNSHIFIVWMVLTSLVLLAVAIGFLRNQIRPILHLADAAEEFGKGRETTDFRPRGALEVRRAAQAFIEMRRRIERQIEQRTTMLAGVSHDLRTVLTRFKLELELLGDSPDVRAMRDDVDEMQRMLEEYLSFAKGDSGEMPEPTDIRAMIDTLCEDARRAGHDASASFAGDPEVTVRPNTMKRCLSNLIGNACRYGAQVHVAARRDASWLTVIIDDDGPGIPEELRETVFRPFLRLDDARNQDLTGSGLGLAIARDVVRGHGGEITLSDSPRGGLRVQLHLPV